MMIIVLLTAFIENIFLPFELTPVVIFIFSFYEQLRYLHDIIFVYCQHKFSALPNQYCKINQVELFMIDSYFKKRHALCVFKSGPIASSYDKNFGNDKVSVIVFFVLQNRNLTLARPAL